MLCAYFIVYCSVQLFAVDDSTAMYVVIGYFSLLLFLVWFDSLSLFNLVCVLVVVFFSFCLMRTTYRHIHWSSLTFTGIFICGATCVTKIPFVWIDLCVWYFFWQFKFFELFSLSTDHIIFCCPKTNLRTKLHHTHQNVGQARYRWFHRSIDVMTFQYFCIIVVQ